MMSLQPSGTSGYYNFIVLIFFFIFFFFYFFFMVFQNVLFLFWVKYTFGP